jgi:hypothetical protein
MQTNAVQFIVIDRTVPARLKVEYHQLLEDTIAAAGDQWKLVGKYPITRAGETTPEGVEVYRLK